MNDIWKMVYLVHPPYPIHWVGFLSALLVPSLAAVIFFHVMRFVGKKLLKSRRLSVAFSFVGPLIVLAVVVNSEIVRYKYSREDKARYDNAVSLKCDLYQGIVGRVYSPEEDDQEGFLIGAKKILYTGRSAGLNKRICYAEGPGLCVGDTGRVCVNKSDQAVIRIDKRRKDYGGYD